MLVWADGAEVISRLRCLVQNLRFKNYLLTFSSSHVDFCWTWTIKFTLSFRLQKINSQTLMINWRIHNLLDQTLRQHKKCNFFQYYAPVLRTMLQIENTMQTASLRTKALFCDQFAMELDSILLRRSLFVHMLHVVTKFLKSVFPRAVLHIVIGLSVLEYMKPHFGPCCIQIRFCTLSWNFILSLAYCIIESFVGWLLTKSC